MKFTYDTVTDRVTSPDLDAERTAQIQAQLSAALIRNDPVRTVAQMLMTFASSPTATPTQTGVTP